ncbi:FAD-dependent oxidoreductase [Crateriforma conspicua]|uniref:NADH dehydrogenase-like protein YjlD n=1 Tax=Crateriforma conspicua TaxID=2527996 RepID=A0A5C6FQM7_9PLAN|nr:FAD-dependent oxidoreductase [Crateriforma conspicua]TWU64574.1 NADH dehydrogenase-like protein YjlD [Crateriforma conspicua]
MRQRNLVLLGIGHTNAHIVKQWETNPIPGCKLTCISKFPTATYSGMLPGTLGLQFDDDEMRIDLADLCQRSGAELILADTNGLDLDAGLLHFEDHESIPFDALSIGVGSMPAGWNDHKHANSLVPIKPMQTFLERLADRLDRSGRGHESSHRDGLVASSTTNKPTTKVAIVGGGVASVEIALCLKQQCEKRNIACDFSIEIFTSSDAIAEGMKPRSVKRIEQILKSRSIHITPGHRVTEVGDDFITTEDGSRHEADIVIWATGAAAPPVLGKLGLQTDDRGFIATSSTLQSLSDPRVFAVGDSGTILESPSPKAGVYAVRQCPILWHNLRAFFDGGSMKTFDPQSDFLKLLNTGDGRALLQYGFINAHARWCWHLKTWIDKRFITEFQSNHQRSSSENTT